MTRVAANMVRVISTLETPRASRLRTAGASCRPRAASEGHGSLAPDVTRRRRRWERASGSGTPHHEGGHETASRRYRLGGRERNQQHGGSFATKALANVRAGWIAGELAAMRVPDLQLLEPAAPAAPLTLGQIAAAWRASASERWSEQDRRTCTGSRVRAHLQSRPGARAAPRRRRHGGRRGGADRGARWAGYKRETIKKTRDSARAGARLPRRRGEPGPRQAGAAAEGAEAARPPPLAEHAGAGLLGALPRRHVLPLLIVDAVPAARSRQLADRANGDLDEARRSDPRPVERPRRTSVTGTWRTPTTCSRRCWRRSRQRERPRPRRAPVRQTSPKCALRNGDHESLPRRNQNLPTSRPHRPTAAAAACTTTRTSFAGR